MSRIYTSEDVVAAILDENDMVQSNKTIATWSNNYE